MYTISLIGGPRRPPVALTLCLMFIIAILLGGCGSKEYRKVPLCDIVPPPAAGRYLDATPDEQTIMMTDVYIAQMKVTSECNDNIDLVNASNKAK